MTPNGTSFVAVVHDGDQQETYKYKMLEGTTLNVVELTAIKFAALGSQGACAITTKNRYIADMLGKDADGNWLKDPKANTELVNEVREVIEQKSALVEFDKDSKARELCR